MDTHARKDLTGLGDLSGLRHSPAIRPPPSALSLLFIVLLIPLLAASARAQSTAAATLELYGTFHAMGVIVTIAAADDADQDTTATVEYRTGSAPYRAGFPLPRVSDTRFVGSLFWLDPGVSYDVRVTFDDPDSGPLHGGVVTTTGATRAEIAIPTPTHSFYVAPGGNGTWRPTGNAATCAFGAIRFTTC